jgi:hypothetical protein
MSGESDPFVSGTELHEEFIQRVERSGRAIRRLSLLTVFVAGVLAASYFGQLVLLPFALGVKTQTVDLVDPALMALEAVLLALTLAWLYIGVRDYAFVGKLERQVREIRALQAEAAKKYGLE